MKNVIRLLGIAVILVCGIAGLRSGARAGASGKAEYTITVNGGHATNLRGETISMAEPGTEIIVYHDVTPGKYWKRWKSTVMLKENTIVCRFTMPSRHVTIAAETVETQKAYTLDLTETTPNLSAEDTYLLRNAFICWKNSTDIDDLDFNKDGHLDLHYCRSREEISRWGLSNYSLGTYYEVKIPDGEIGTVRIVIDNDKTSAPVRVEGAKPHKITAPQGTVYLENYGKFPGDITLERITEATPGEKIDVKLNGVPEGMYLKYVKINGTTSLINPGNSSCQFYMPPRDVTVEFIFAEQSPLRIDLSEGPIELSDSDFMDFKKAITSTYVGNPFENANRGIDFDRDYEFDIVFSKSGSLRIMEANRTPFTEQHAEVTCSRKTGGVYWPVTVIFPDYANIPVTPTPTPSATPTTTPTPTALPTAMPAPTATEKVLPTQAPKPDGDDEEDSKLRYILMLGGSLVLLTMAVVAFLLLKKDKPKPPNDSFNDWNEDRVIINASSGVASQPVPPSEKEQITDLDKNK